MSYLSLVAQDFSSLKQIQKELDADYDYYAKADPNNIGAKRLAGKIGILDQGITVLIKKQDATTFEDVYALTEDLIKETQKYSSQKAKNTQKISKKLLHELDALKPEFGISTTTNENQNNNVQLVNQQKEKSKNETPPAEAKDTLDKQETPVIDEETHYSDDKPKSKEEVKVYDEPLASSSDQTIFYAAIGLLALLVIIVFISMNQAIKKLAHEVREKHKEHDREIEGIEKTLVNATSMQPAQLTNFKEEVQKKFDTFEVNTLALFAEADKKINELKNEIKLLEKAKLDLAQYEALKVQMEKLISKEQLDQALQTLHEKIKNTEKDLKTTSLLSTVVAAKIQNSFEEHKPHLIDALEEFKRKTHNESFKELIDSQLPLLHVAKSIEDCNLMAFAKLVQMGFVASYNENIVSPYEKLTASLRFQGFDIEDALIGRMALSEFYAENIPLPKYLSNPNYRTTDYPNFIAVKYEIENNPLTTTALPNSVLFILYPTVFISHQGSKQLLKKGEYILKTA